MHFSEEGILLSCFQYDLCFMCSVTASLHLQEDGSSQAFWGAEEWRSWVVTTFPLVTTCQKKGGITPIRGCHQACRARLRQVLRKESREGDVLDVCTTGVLGVVMQEGPRPIYLLQKDNWAVWGKQQGRMGKLVSALPTPRCSPEKTQQLSFLIIVFCFPPRLPQPGEKGGRVHGHLCHHHHHYHHHQCELLI